MKSLSEQEKETIERSLVKAPMEKPAYGDLYPLLKALFSAQFEIKRTLRLEPVELTPQVVQTKWEEGFPLLRRWEFPVDIAAAEAILIHMKEHIPEGNQALQGAFDALWQSLSKHPEQKADLWQSFLHHEWEPWEEWVDASGVDIPSLLFWARNALRPSLEATARDLLARFPLPAQWLKGYCPVCGSLPALLFLEGEGERKGHCSWCSTVWGLHRLQCPYCDNRYHESLGYISIEAEPQYRVQYCRICKMYFKLIDLREQLDGVYFPLEEWTTLHLDLLAQRAGWKQPPSPSPVVYGESRP